MNKQQAINAFFNRFGTFYEINAVPGGTNRPAFPYGTFEFASDSWGGMVAISANWWERSSSWEAAAAKTREIERAVSRGGCIIPCEGGAIRIEAGVPFARNMGDEADPALKRILFNFNLEYLTED